jgi:IS5 family transposase
LHEKDDYPNEQPVALRIWLERAWRICRQRPKDKNKLYALHAPEVECISKGKARQPYEFGVKVSLAITENQGLIVGARSFAGNPYDGHTLAGQLEQTNILLQHLPGSPKPKTVLADPGFRRVDADVAPVQLIHRGKHKTISTTQRKWLKRRQAIEPIIGHVKQDHSMQRCWLKGQTGDALHAVLYAAGYNRRWRLRAIVRLGLAPVFFCSRVAALPTQRLATNLARAPHNHLRRGSTTATDRPLGSVRKRNRILQVGLCSGLSIALGLCGWIPRDSRNVANPSV